MSGAGFSFFCLELVVARSDYAGYDIGPFPIGSQLPMCGVFSRLQKFFLEPGRQACNSWV